MSKNIFPKLHNAMWPGLVGKGSPGAEPAISLDTMLNLTAAAEVNGVKFDGVDLFLFAPHVDIDAKDDELKRLADKVRALRVFPDADGRMNEPLGDREVLCVSQFTLYGDVRRGNRPSYVAAAPPEIAEPLYERFCELLGAQRGRFGAHMRVELVNDGPVTLLLESR